MKDSVKGSGVLHLVLVVVVFGLLPGGVFAEVGVLAFEVEAFDLETGQVVDIDPRATPDEAKGDFWFGYHADRSIHAVLLPNLTAGVEIAFLNATLFDAVSYGDVANLSFTARFNDEPFDNDDTVVLRTGLGDFFKIGNAEESLNYVSFEYAQLHEDIAAFGLAPDESAAGSVDAGPAFKGLSADGSREMLDLVEAAEYRFTSVAPDEGGGFRARNPEHSFEARFASDGVTITLLGKEERTLELTLLRYGYSGAGSPLIEPELVVEGNRLEYRRGDLVEWYINGERGLEQGMTVAAPPAPSREGPLTVELELSGDFVPRWIEEGALLALEPAGGDSVLHYGGLAAWDAEERDLPVQLAWAEDKLALQVDDSGAVYPVTIDPLFTTEAKLTASDAHMDHYFGTSVALSGDYLIVGTPYDGWYLGNDTGAAYILERVSGVWTEKKKLVSETVTGYDWFGSDVAAGGERVAVTDSVDGEVDELAGAVYVYARDGGLWNLEEKLLASDGAVEDRFGRDVDIDGDTLVVGAIGNTSADPYVGAAYVFVHDGAGWREQGKLTASDGAAYDYFGTSVSISGDTAVVSAYGDDDLGSFSGAVYVYRRSGEIWTETEKLTADDGAAGDYFGRVVDIAGDMLVVGGPTELVELPGMAYESGWFYPFTYSDSSWNQELKVPVNGFTGSVLEFSESGDMLVVGAPNDPDRGFNSGAVLTFVRSGGVWTEDQKITVADGGEYDDLGHSATISGTTVVAGAPGDMDEALFSGAAYVFLLGADGDGDGEPDDSDNCVSTPNPDQADTDGSGIGDACNDHLDQDGDEYEDDSDNCSGVLNGAQTDIDSDGVGDLCDICPADPLNECNADPEGSGGGEVPADEGGDIGTGDGGANISIPPDALVEDTTITITRTVFNDPAADLALTTGTGLGQRLSVYDLQPDGLEFTSPIQITIVLDLSTVQPPLNTRQRENLALYFQTESGDLAPIEPIEGYPHPECSIDAEIATCTAWIEHFSVYALVAPLDADGDGILDSFNDSVDVCPDDPNIVDGFLEPLVALVPADEDEVPLPDKALKANRTLPMKLDYFCGTVPLTDQSGASPPQILELRRVSDADPLDVVDPDSGEANDSGVSFRYSDDHWVFNFNTQGLPQGTYEIVIGLPDGRPFKGGFVLR